MSAQQTSDFSTLRWIKPELDETLQQALSALEIYVNDPSDGSQIQLCASYLHQVQGTLRMVELYGAAMVAEEMEHLALDLQSGEVNPQEDTYSVLMRGIVQLPDYLERLQSGHKDIPIVLLPLLNDLRACRGQKLLSESALFAPNLDALLPLSAAGASQPLAAKDLRQQSGNLRTAYLAALLKWFRNDTASEPLQRLTAILDRLRALCTVPDARRLWWIAAGVIEGVQTHSVEPSVALKLLFGKIDRDIRRLQVEGEIALVSNASRELAKNLLYYVAHASTVGARGAELRTTYDLSSLLPTEPELEHARGSIAGHNRSLLDTVAAAIRDDLVRVKEALDIFLRLQPRDPAQLHTQAEILDRVGDTLGMLGLGIPRRLVGEQRQALVDIANGIKPVEESSLLDIAGTLIHVESSLDDHIERLGAPDDQGDVGGILNHLPTTEVRRILDALMYEAAINLSQAKHDVVSFIEAPWQHMHMAPVPHRLEEVAGALVMLDLAEPAQLMAAIQRFIEVELLQYRRVPNAQQLDRLADAFASMEYYLEAVRERRGGRAEILDATRRSLAALGYWPLPERAPGVLYTPIDETEPSAGAISQSSEHAGAGEAAQVAALIDEPSSEMAPVAHEAIIPAQDGYVEVEEEIVEEVPEYEFAPTTTRFETVSTNEIDADIREVFLEEVGEEIQRLRENLVLWQAHPDNLELLTPVRRSFHTLKGSGRLVGAVAVGEFSWKIENLLNRVLDHTIQSNLDVEALVKRAVDALPGLLNALSGHGEVDSDLGEIAHTADRFASGESTSAEPLEPRMRTVTRVVRRRVPRSMLAPVPSENTAESTTPRSAVSDPGTVHFAPSPIDAPTIPVAKPTSPESWSGIDPVLFDILRSEVAAHLEVVDAYLELVDTHSAPVPVSEVLVRALHTLNGAIATVEIPVLGSVLAPMESYIKGVYARSGALDMDGTQVLAETSALIKKVMLELESVRPQWPSGEELAQRISALRDVEPASKLPFEDHIAHLDAQTFAHGESIYEKDATPHSDNDSGTLQTFARSELGDAHADNEIGVDEEITPSSDDEASYEYGSELDNHASHRHVRDVESTGESQDLHAPAPLNIEGYDLHIADAEGFDSVEFAEPIRAPAHEVAAGQEETDSRVEDPFVVDENEHMPVAHDGSSIIEIVAAAPIGDSHAELTATPLDEVQTPTTAQEDTGAPAREQNAEASHSPEFTAFLDETPAPPIADDVEPEGRLNVADIDDDLLEVFVQEGVDILDQADALLTRLHRSPYDREILGGLQRELHTLKGGARMASLEPIGDLSHAMESLIEAISEQRRPMNRATMDSFERGFDRLHRLIQRVSRRQAIGMPVNAIVRFEALVVGEALHTPTAAPSAAGHDGDVRAPVPVVSRPRLVVRADEEEVAPRATHEMIRVRAVTLDQLVNYAGEVSIYRSRLEQQVGSFRSNLVELEQTVSRLRDQLRKLEIETEAQILSRFQREHVGTNDADFDPLELDRFSQLQQLSRALAESVSDLVSIQNLLDDQARQSETLLLQQSRVSTDLQEGLMRTRMVPFDSMVPSLRRTLRQTAEETGKRALLEVQGAQGEMDRNLLERMKAPFEHMLRNALAHGIETPEERLAAGKPAEGNVRIAVSREATEVLIRVSDDGRGLDREAIRQRAIERNLLTHDAQPADVDLYNFILQTGFSTASQITQIAGRGVGMDVVYNEIKQLGGSLAIQSTPAQGCSFSIRLPFTLAVAQAILVRIGEVSYAIPMQAVQGVARIESKDFVERMTQADPLYTYLGEQYQLCELNQLLGTPTHRNTDEQQHPLLLTRAGELRAAIRIDLVIGSREIVVKSVGPQISSVPGIFGATIMGDGSVVMILDIASLLRRFAARNAQVLEAPEEISIPVTPIAPLVQHRAIPLIMVVDDSITMRKVTSRVLERSEMAVVTAKDGLDAIDKMQDQIPDLMLLDIEMPRMDGYELATHMRNDARLRNIPIIMITSRSGEKHRQRALEIGVERYLGKPYQEADLLVNIRELLGARRDA